MNLIGLHEFYSGCMALGFVYVAGSFLLSGAMRGSHSRGGMRGTRGGGRGTIRAGRAVAIKGGAARGTSAARGGMRTGARGSLKGAPPRATTIKSGGARSAAPKAGVPKGSGAVKGGAPKGMPKAAPARGTSSQQTAPRGTTSQGTTGTAKGNGAPRASAPKGMVRHNASFVGDESLEGTELILSGRPDVEPTERLYFLLLQVVNPLAWSIMLFFFGAAGLLILRLGRDFPLPSYIPAAVIGFTFGIAVQRCLDWFVGRFESPPTSTIDDAIGSVGEVTAAITKGHVGEVVIIFDNARRNYPARALNPEADMPKGTKVLIIDIKDNLLFVERYNEESMLEEGALNQECEAARQGP